MEIRPGSICLPWTGKSIEITVLYLYFMWTKNTVQKLWQLTSFLLHRKHAPITHKNFAMQTWCKNFCDPHEQVSLLVYIFECIDVIRNAYFYAAYSIFNKLVWKIMIFYKWPIFTQWVTYYKEWKFWSQLFYGKIKISCIYICTVFDCVNCSDVLL